MEKGLRNTWKLTGQCSKSPNCPEAETAPRERRLEHRSTKSFWSSSEARRETKHKQQLSSFDQMTMDQEGFEESLQEIKG